ncbi:MAG: hypothetical protein GX639_05385 [Fibrobacter sp.]|nr:hypothetical protein [Fibrobacter sp.]
MKKYIDTYDELLTSLALSGDCAAFHSLIEPHFRTCYVKMVSEGMPHGEVSEKLCEQAVALYKTFLASGRNAIDSLPDSEFEKNENRSKETDFLQSDVVNSGEQQFSREMMHSLQLFKRNYKGKFRNVQKFSHGLTFSKRIWLFVVVIIAGVSGYLLFFSSSGFDIQIVKKTNTKSSGSLMKNYDSLVKSIDVSSVRDTVKKDTLKDTVRKVDTVPKPKPKPRRTVAEVPQPVGSAEIMNAFDASPVVQPSVKKEQPVQTQTPPDAGQSLPQAGSSDDGVKSTTPPVPPQPSTQSQDSSWGF